MVRPRWRHGFAVVIANAGRETILPGANILRKEQRGIE